MTNTAGPTATDRRSPGASPGLGLLLLRARRSRARSQQRIAEELCAVAGTSTVSRHEISRWERGERLPSPYWLAWLGVVLDLPIRDLERAVAVTRGGRARPRPVVAVSTPGSWPWRMITGWAVHLPDGGVRLQAGPPPTGRRPALSARSTLARAIAAADPPTDTVAS
jgi:hypothetical protein